MVACSDLSMLNSRFPSRSTAETTLKTALMSVSVNFITVIASRVALNSVWSFMPGTVTWPCDKNLYEEKSSNRNSSKHNNMLLISTSPSRSQTNILNFITHFLSDPCLSTFLGGWLVKPNDWCYYRDFGGSTYISGTSVVCLLFEANFFASQIKLQGRHTYFEIDCTFDEQIYGMNVETCWKYGEDVSII